MSDAKRTPYRAPGARPEPTRSRGPVVQRADEPAPDPLRPPAPQPPPRLAARDAAPLPSAPVAPADPDGGVFSGLVSPHPRSTSGEWAAQIALTLAGLPLLASTFLLVGWLDSRRAWSATVQRGHLAPRPLGIAHPVAWVFGAMPLALLGFAREWPWPAVVVLVAVPFAALAARRVLRARILDREELAALLARARR